METIKIGKSEFSVLWDVRDGSRFLVPFGVGTSRYTDKEDKDGEAIFVQRQTTKVKEAAAEYAKKRAVVKAAEKVAKKAAKEAAAKAGK